MKKSSIYTRTGDAGTTSLVGGKRVKKTDIRLEAYGTVDEFNSFLGYLTISAKMSYPDLYKYLLVVQSKMFNIGGYLATDNSNNAETPCRGLCEADIEAMELKIDEIYAELPPLRNFILPGGSTLSASAHICRTVARRCERRVLALAEVTYVDPVVLKYINRLSDFLFAFARFNNVHNQIEESLWNPDC